MTRADNIIFGFILGAVLVSIPLMWNIEDLEAKIAEKNLGYSIEQLAELCHEMETK